MVSCSRRSGRVLPERPRFLDAVSMRAASDPGTRSTARSATRACRSSGWPVRGSRISARRCRRMPSFRSSGPAAATFAEQSAATQSVAL